MFTILTATVAGVADGSLAVALYVQADAPEPSHLSVWKVYLSAKTSGTFVGAKSSKRMFVNATGGRRGRWRRGGPRGGGVVPLVAAPETEATLVFGVMRLGGGCGWGRWGAAMVGTWFEVIEGTAETEESASRTLVEPFKSGAWSPGVGDEGTSRTGGTRVGETEPGGRAVGAAHIAA